MAMPPFIGMHCTGLRPSLPFEKPKWSVQNYALEIQKGRQRVFWQKGRNLGPMQEAVNVLVECAQNEPAI